MVVSNDIAKIFMAVPTHVDRNCKPGNFLCLSLRSKEVRVTDLQQVVQSAAAFCLVPQDADFSFFAWNRVGRM